MCPLVLSLPYHPLPPPTPSVVSPAKPKMLDEICTLLFSKTYIMVVLGYSSFTAVTMGERATL